MFRFYNSGKSTIQTTIGVVSFLLLPVIVQAEFGSVVLYAIPSYGGSAFVENGPGSYGVGETVSIYAQPNCGWTFTDWEEDGFACNTCMANPYTFILPVGIIFTAYFSPTNDTINTSSSPVGGDSTSGGGSTTCSSSVTVVASPASCYKFVNWNEGGNVVSTAMNYTFMDTGSRNLQANFQQRLMTITVSGSPVNGGRVSGSGSYPCGSAHQISATVSRGWAFIGWNDFSTDNPRNIIMPSGRATFIAYFRSLSDYVSLTETYQDQIGYDSGKNAFTYPTGSFTINAVLFTGNRLAAASFDKNTPVAINFGNWSYQGANNTLSDDPKYKAKATKATLPLTYQDSTGKTKSTGAATLGFGKKNTTLAISAKAGQDAQGDDIQGFIDADTIPANAAPGKSVAVGDTVLGTITIGDYTEWFTNIVITGTEAAKNSKAKDGNTFQLDTVKIKGASQR